MNQMVSTEDLEALVLQVSGVQECRVVASPAGTISEIHVLATADRSPKSIVRDVESALKARYALEIDHRKISVAQISEAQAVPVRMRLLLHAHQMRINNSLGEIAFTVTVSLDQESFTGEATGLLVGASRRRLVAQATIAAIGQALSVPSRFSVEEASVVRVAGYDVVVIAVSTEIQGHNEEVLVGTAISPGDEIAATIRATLDALNRRIAPYLKRGTVVRE